MSARSILNYNTDAKLKNCIDETANFITNIIETTYNVAGPTQILRDCIHFFLIHKTFIVVKMPVDEQYQFIIIHPELDDVSINMEPIPRLTFTRYLPLSQKEERLVIGENNFKVYEGSIADINFPELLRFLGYTEIQQ